MFYTGLLGASMSEGGCNYWLDYVRAVVTCLRFNVHPTNL